jgi:tetratricopeptide (TPR) repeat protein
MTRHPLLADLRRMAPVWGIVAGTAVLATLGMRAAAEHHLRAALAASPNACAYAAVHVARGINLVDQMREQGGAVILESLKPGDPSLGVLRDRPVVAEARAAFRKAIALCPDLVEAHTQLALAEWYGGDLAACYLALARALVLQQRPAEAIINYRLALETAPDSIDALAGLSMALRRAGNRREALDLLLPRLEAVEAVPSGRAALGLALAANGEHRRALDPLRAALADSPADSDLIRALADSAIAVGEERSAADFLLQLAGPEGRLTAVGYHHAAILYGRLGDLQAEANALRNAVRLAPNNVGLRTSLAICLHRLGNTAAARDEIRRAMEIDIRYVLERIRESGVDPR